MSYLRSNKLEKEVTEWFLQVFLSIFFTRFLERPFAFEKVSERYSFDRPCVVAGMGRHGRVDSCLNNTRFSKTPHSRGHLSLFPCLQRKGYWHAQDQKKEKIH